MHLASFLGLLHELLRSVKDLGRNVYASLSHTAVGLEHEAMCKSDAFEGLVFADLAAEAQVDLNIVDVPAGATDLQWFARLVLISSDYARFSGGTRIHSPENDLLEQERSKLIHLSILEADKATPLMLVRHTILSEAARLDEVAVSVTVGDANLMRVGCQLQRFSRNRFAYAELDRR